MALFIQEVSSTDDLFIRANAFLAQDRPEQAENLYSKILRQYQEPHGEESGNPFLEAEIYHNLGMIAENRGNIDSAIAFYEKSVAINNKRGATWLFLAKAYLEKYRLGRNPRDIHLGKKAIQWAEASECVYPAVGWLKIEYQKVS